MGVFQLIELPRGVGSHHQEPGFLESELLPVGWGGVSQGTFSVIGSPG